MPRPREPVPIEDQQREDAARREDEMGAPMAWTEDADDLAELPAWFAPSLGRVDEHIAPEETWP